MDENINKPQEQKKEKLVLDENFEIPDREKLPIHEPLKVLRYRTLKKNPALGWWSAVVLLEDHDKRLICFYRWRRINNQWRRDKKLPIRSHDDWQKLKTAVESFLKDLV